MIKALQNPKKKGVNLTLTEDEISELNEYAKDTAHKPTTLATVLYRRALEDLKAAASLEEFLKPRITVSKSKRFSEETQRGAFTALSMIFSDADSEAIGKVIEVLGKFATRPWSRAMQRELVVEAEKEKEEEKGIEGERDSPRKTKRA